MGGSESAPLEESCRGVNHSVPRSAFQFSCLSSDIDTTRVDVGKYAAKIEAAQMCLPVKVARPVASIGEAHECYVRTVTWDPFRDLLISGGGDGWIRLWSTADYKFVAELDAKLSVRSLLVLAGELASGHSNGEVILWDLESSRRPRTQVLKAHNEAVYALALLQNGDLVTGAEDIRVFTRSMIMGFQLVLQVAEEVLCMCVVPRTSLVVTGDMNSLIHVWDSAEDFRVAAKCHGHDRSVWCVCYINEADRVASGGADQTLRIWNTRTWTCERILRDHTGWVVGLSVGPGWLFSCSNDQSVRVWDVQEWVCAHTFSDQEYEVYCVCAFSGGRLAAAGAECKIVVYGGPDAPRASVPQNLLQAACSPLPRGQTTPRGMGSSPRSAAPPPMPAPAAAQPSSFASWAPSWFSSAPAQEEESFRPQRQSAPDSMPAPAQSGDDARQRRAQLMAKSDLDITMSDFSRSLVHAEAPHTGVERRDVPKISNMGIDPQAMPRGRGGPQVYNLDNSVHGGPWALESSQWLTPKDQQAQADRPRSKSPVPVPTANFGAPPQHGFPDDNLFDTVAAPPRVDVTKLRQQRGVPEDDLFDTMAAPPRVDAASLRRQRAVKEAQAQSFLGAGLEDGLFETAKAPPRVDVEELRRQTAQARAEAANAPPVQEWSANMLSRGR